MSEVFAHRLHKIVSANFQQLLVEFPNSKKFFSRVFDSKKSFYLEVDPTKTVSTLKLMFMHDVEVEISPTTLNPTFHQGGLVSQYTKLYMYIVMEVSL